METETDQQDYISPVTKYSYLKEFLLPHVRKLVDRLPFTSQGYFRAKEILQPNSDKPIVVANPHVNCIVSLFVVFESLPNKFHDFFEKLMSSVQAVETMRKLNQIKSYVRNILDKLPGTMADLVKLDDKSQGWECFELVEALRKWTDRNPKIISSEGNVYHTNEIE